MLQVYNVTEVYHVTEVYCYSRACRGVGGGGLVQSCHFITKISHSAKFLWITQPCCKVHIKLFLIFITARGGGGGCTFVCLVSLYLAIN